MYELYEESYYYPTNIFYNLFQLLNDDTDFINIFYKSTKEENLFKYMFNNNEDKISVKNYFAPFGHYLYLQNTLNIEYVRS